MANKVAGNSNEMPEWQKNYPRTIETLPTKAQRQYYYLRYDPIVAPDGSISYLDKYTGEKLSSFDLNLDIEKKMLGQVLGANIQFPETKQQALHPELMEQEKPTILGAAPVVGGKPIAGATKVTSSRAASAAKAATSPQAASATQAAASPQAKVVVQPPRGFAATQPAPEPTTTQASFKAAAPAQAKTFTQNPRGFNALESRPVSSRAATAFKPAASAEQIIAANEAEASAAAAQNQAAAGEAQAPIPPPPPGSAPLPEAVATKQPLLTRAQKVGLAGTVGALGLAGLGGRLLYNQPPIADQTSTVPLPAAGQPTAVVPAAAPVAAPAVPVAPVKGGAKKMGMAKGGTKGMAKGGAGEAPVATSMQIKEKVAGGAGGTGAGGMPLPTATPDIPLDASGRPNYNYYSEMLNPADANNAYYRDFVNLREQARMAAVEAAQRGEKYQFVPIRDVKSNYVYFVNANGDDIALDMNDKQDRDRFTRLVSDSGVDPIKMSEWMNRASRPLLRHMMPGGRFQEAAPDFNFHRQRAQESVDTQGNKLQFGVPAMPAAEQMPSPSTKMPEPTAQMPVPTAQVPPAATPPVPAAKPAESMFGWANIPPDRNQAYSEIAAMGEAQRKEALRKGTMTQAQLRQIDRNKGKINW